jgi:hypothetical protein
VITRHDLEQDIADFYARWVAIKQRAPIETEPQYAQIILARCGAIIESTRLTPFSSRLHG